MHSISTEKAIKNQVASAKMEGLGFSKEAIKLIKEYADNRITHDKLIKIVAQKCAAKS
ncbi:hypothetical protein [Ruminococcus flavefaciens]|uniref:hypothetical protein n=1 Tax=Ruminococcus flavefaciens TaxID=1265 RepID=UPI0004BBDA73|nr:hypothetical protein [Ruminococcus flavefaciens]